MTFAHVENTFQRSSLVNRNVVVNGKRTSVRLEPAMWDALVEIGRREDRTVHEISSEVDRDRPESSRPASLRVHTMSYFREAATAEGHSRAGHGVVAAGAYPGSLGGGAALNVRRRRLPHTTRKKVRARPSP